MNRVYVIICLEVPLKKFETANHTKKVNLINV
jgi:hypothetical protein